LKRSETQLGIGFPAFDPAAGKRQQCEQAERWKERAANLAESGGDHELS
jgi:hypothetical protein